MARKKEEKKKREKKRRCGEKKRRREKEGKGWVWLLNSRKRRSVFSVIAGVSMVETVRWHGRRGAPRRWLLPRLWWSEEGGKREKKKRGEKKREEKRKKRRKKEEDRRRRIEGEREEEGSLVHGEIARPLTILRYYARPFLQRSLCSLARTNRRPSWNMVYRKRERSAGRRRRTGSCPVLPRSGWIDPINEDQSSDTRKNLTRSHLSRELLTDSSIIGEIVLDLRIIIFVSKITSLVNFSVN